MDFATSPKQPEAGLPLQLPVSSLEHLDRQQQTKLEVALQKVTVVDLHSQLHREQKALLSWVAKRHKGNLDLAAVDWLDLTDAFARLDVEVAQLSFACFQVQ